MNTNKNEIILNRYDIYAVITAMKKLGENIDREITRERCIQIFLNPTPKNAIRILKIQGLDHAMNGGKRYVIR